jgi:hypothetical protein
VLVDPHDLGLVLELRRTKADVPLLAGDLDAAAALPRPVWADVRSAGPRTVRPLAGIDLLWLAVISGDDAQVRALGDALAELPGGAVAAHCAAAIVATGEGRSAESAGHLLDAMDRARRDGVPLADNDVLAIAALRAVHLSEPERACRLLTASAGGARSPGSLALQRHARAMVGVRLGRDEVTMVRSAAQRDGPSGVVAAEFDRLRAETATAVGA